MSPTIRHKARVRSVLAAALTALLALATVGTANAGPITETFEDHSCRPFGDNIQCIDVQVTTTTNTSSSGVVQTRYSSSVDGTLIGASCNSRSHDGTQGFIIFNPNGNRQTVQQDVHHFDFTFDCSGETFSCVGKSTFQLVDDRVVYERGSTTCV